MRDMPAATKQPQSYSTGAGMKLLTEDPQQIERLRAERQSLTGDIYKGLEGAEKLFGNLESITLDQSKTREVTKDLSDIDRGLAKYGQYKETMGELAVGLAASLDGYVGFVAQSRNYEWGLEKVLSWLPMSIGTREADRRRNIRLRSAAPKETLKIVLDFATQLYEEICKTREDALLVYQRLNVNSNLITTKIAHYEPIEAALKEKKDIMEADFSALEERYTKAGAQEQAQMLPERTQKREALALIRSEYDQVFTKYSIAQQTLTASEKSRDSFEQMVRDLGRQATMVKEKVDDATQIYQAAPHAVKIMMSTKGMEIVDRTMNTTLAETVELIGEAADDVMRTTTAREAVQFLTDAELKSFVDKVTTMAGEFDRRYSLIRASAQRSQAERYAAGDADASSGNAAGGDAKGGPV